MCNRQLMRLLGATAIAGGLSMGLASAADAATTICLTQPKAQLGQGNNAPTDVSEPVRGTLTSYMAGPTTTLVQLQARIPIQIDAEAAAKGCTYVLQTSVTQKKGGSAGGFLKKMAPLASALPMVGGMGGSVNGAIAATAVSSAVTTAGAQAAQDDYFAAMTGAQQSNVKKGDTILAEFVLTAPGNPTPLKQDSLERKAKQNGEDLIGPLLEQIATEVVTFAAAK